MRLLNLMANGEICVCFFVEILGQPQPKISRHLAYLRSAGLVGTRREAKWMHYRLTPPEHPAARLAFDAVLQTFDGRPRAPARPRHALESLHLHPRPGTTPPRPATSGHVDGSKRALANIVLVERWRPAGWSGGVSPPPCVGRIRACKF